MYPNEVRQQQNKQAGSMLVLALFVIIVLGLLGVTMTRLLSSTSDSIVYEVLGQRALNAARSGIECKVAEQFPVDDAVNCLQPDNNTFVDVPGLENCGYSTSYDSQTITDGAESFSYHQFTSTGECFAGDIFVSRTVYVDAMESE